MFDPNFAFGFKNIIVVENILALKKYCNGLYIGGFAPKPLTSLFFYYFFNNFILIAGEFNRVKSPEQLHMDR